MEEKAACDRQEAVEWAQGVLKDGCVILDMKATGLYDAEPVEIAVIDHTGAVLFNSQVKLLRPERLSVAVKTWGGMDMTTKGHKNTIARPCGRYGTLKAQADAGVSQTQVTPCPSAWRDVYHQTCL